MPVPRIAINGFGRIGRTVMRIAKLRKRYDVVAINDLAGPDQLFYAFKYDSVHGVYPGEVKLDGRTMTIDNDPFEILSESDPARLPWQALGVDYGLTISCYQPDETGAACGVCDSCRLRRAGFEAAGVPDPTRYRD